jgi:hypothetical protein
VRARSVQADNPAPSSFGLDDDSVIDRMTAELQGATQGMAAGFKLQPVQFEKVSSLEWQLGWQLVHTTPGH